MEDLELQLISELHEKLEVFRLVNDKSQEQQDTLKEFRELIQNRLDIK